MKADMICDVIQNLDISWHLITNERRCFFLDVDFKLYLATMSLASSKARHATLESANKNKKLMMNSQICILGYWLGQRTCLPFE